MAVFNMREAKVHFPDLLEIALSGEEVVITKAGKPVARLLPYSEINTVPRQPGNDKGKVIIQPNFDKPLREFNR